MLANPHLTDVEWAALSPLVKPNKHARAVDDRVVALAFFLAEVRGVSLEMVGPALGVSGATLRTRRARWLADGTLPKLLEPGAAVTARLRREQFGSSGDVMRQQAEAMERLAKLCGFD